MHLDITWLLRTRSRVLELVLGWSVCRKYPVRHARHSEGAVPLAGNPLASRKN